ncbi:MAG: bifunctional serine/threonine-protein kinase/formylglycine-generating enzyme family protein [Myxococcota bacterium]
MEPESERTARTWVGEPSDAPIHQPDVELPEGYVDKGLIAHGGMGEVRLAWDERMSRDVAIKVLAPSCLRDPDIVRRFHDESLTMARLDHPAIVAVHARGVLSDGRPWYAMRRVRGLTLREMVSQADVSLPRLLTHLASIARGVAYAHEQGIVHCDLKPENLLVGPFGEVQVLDWGIALRIGMPDRRGLGTPGYMAPEQQGGGTVEGGTDVFALGRVLQEIMDRFGTDMLSDLVDRTQARQAAERPSALAFADAIEAELDGEAKREEALALLEAAEVVNQDCERLEAQAQSRLEEGEAALRLLSSHADPSEKYEAWAALDEAERWEAEAESVRVDWFRMVHAALQTSPDLPEAHEMLAHHHHHHAKRAAARSDHLAEVRHRQLLKQHDQGRYQRYLRGRAALTLITEPEGVLVKLSRFEVQHRRLVPVPVKELGRTPLREVDVPSGSLLLTLHPEGRPPLGIPAFVESGESWVTVRPGQTEPWRHRLPPAEGLGDACWMPAGWFVSGGDPVALDGLRRRRLFIADRLVQKHVVTNRQYLAFLNHLWRDGQVDRAWEMAPGTTVDGGAVRYAVRLGPDGFGLEGWTESMVWQLDWPVALITWTAAQAYATWWSEQTGSAWRLLHDQEAEKSARGVDGRHFPWGSHFEAAWARVRHSSGGTPQRASIYEHPEDCSVYGVRGVAGNVRIWCGNVYEPSGPDDGTEVRGLGPEPGETRNARGGSWTSEGRLSRSAGRFGGHFRGRYSSVGIRLIRELPSSDS